jgi:translation initiation factor IF-3
VIKIAYNKKDLVNEEIQNPDMLLIDEDGNKLGIFPRSGALAMARAKGLDLVMMSPEAKPAVVKLMNYSKFKFDQQKKQKEFKKSQKVIQVKEIQLSPTIADHDLNIKANQAKKFITSGDKVKVTLKLRGRMITRKEVAEEIMKKFVTTMSDVAVIEGKLKLEENLLLVMLTQKKGE